MYRSRSWRGCSRSPRENPRGPRIERGSCTYAFWGLWLFPLGILVIRSGFLPKILGILVLVAGFAYVIGSFTSLVLPDYKQIVSRVVTPLYFGEVPIIFWLLIKGANEPRVVNP